jgi:hypothetical protein
VPACPGNGQSDRRYAGELEPPVALRLGPEYVGAAYFWSEFVSAGYVGSEFVGAAYFWSEFVGAGYVGSEFVAAGYFVSE